MASWTWRDDRDVVVSAMLPYKKSVHANDFDASRDYSDADAAVIDFSGLPLVMNHQNGLLSRDTGRRKPYRRIGTVLAAAEYGSDTLSLAEIDVSSPHGRQSAWKVATGSYADVSLTNTIVDQASAGGTSLKLPFELTLCEGGRRSGSHTYDYMPSRTTLERFDEATFRDLARHFKYPAPPADFAQSDQKRAQYIQDVHRHSQQRLAAVWSQYKFAPPPPTIYDRSRRIEQHFLSHMSSPAAENSADADQPPAAMDADAPATDDNGLDVASPPPAAKRPNIRDPLEAAQLAREAEKRAADLSKTLAEERARNEEVAKKAAQWEEYQRTEKEKWKRELQSALDSFRDKAKNLKKWTPERIEQTCQFANKTAETDPSASIDHVRGMLEIVTEASEANDRAERAEFERRKTENEKQLNMRFAQIDEEIQHYRQTSMDALSQPSKPYEPPSINFREPDTPAMSVDETPASRDFAPASSNFDAMAVSRDFAQTAAAPPPRPPAATRRATMTLCSDEAGQDVDLSTIPQEVDLFLKRFQRLPTAQEVGYGIQKVRVGIQENSVTGQKTEQFELRRARAQPAAVSLEHVDPAAFNDFLHIADKAKAQRDYKTFKLPSEPPRREMRELPGDYMTL